ncbi:MAG: Omp28-related outer membrane protein [Chlorobi bacterium]|nr:Omp28-related outer membrane protein [Chlorobiota bacterium]MCI0716340.1 Omp28-related outer membrane protein [Chlorobiota bacterium]
MKKHLLIVIALVALVGFNPSSSNAQTGYNALLEYCTGTWCVWCPCGHTIINDILQIYPNTMVIGYHGYTPQNDPWYVHSAPMLGLFGFNSYPSGVIGRRTGIVFRESWNNNVVIQSLTIQPGVSIVVNNKAYNSGTRTITGSVVMTALENLTGSYYVMFVLTEDNLIYPQAGNGSCPGGSNYVHKHVNRDLINGATGTLLNTTDNWTQNTSVTVPLNYTLPSNYVAENCKVNIFVYRGGGSYSTDNYVQQTRMEGVTTPTGIHQQNNVPSEYSLSQNYPNPFNPTTNIVFTIPKSEHVSLKFYDMMGREVATYLDAVVEAGTYKAEVDASSWSSGIYFYTLKTNSFVETKKMTLVK